MDLVIIEGVGKQDTIKKYLGKGYEVFATKGHVRDLPQKTIGVNIQNDFEPKYIIMPDKKDVVKSLKEKSAKANKIYLATDPDREGEAISWHLRHILNLDPNEKARIVFNEISKKAIDKAIENPRVIDQSLVDAQQARRVLDRLVGYQLSPFLNRKINKNHLSAGRVQSVALKLVVDREKEITDFKPVESYLISANLQKEEGKDKTEFVATLVNKNKAKFKPKNKEEADKVLEDLKGKEYVCTEVKKSITKSSANAPFITSTMQQEALNKLNLSLKRTSLAAQSLYEGVNIKGEGKTALITYIRTDSTRISTDAQAMAKDYITEKFGEKFVPEKPNIFKTKKSAQDAHEAIRPIHLDLTPEKVKDSLEADQFKLYKLIFERFLASQMADATFNSVNATISVGDYDFKATGRTVLFQGHLAAYNYEDKNEKDESESQTDSKLPALEEGDKLKLNKLTSAQKFTKPPARYTDASLVKAMEEKGIGRPATYAPTIATIYARLYVEKDGKYIKPTELGQVVCDVLVKNFPNLINVSFTAQMEENLDNIEDGGKRWQDEIKDFYQDFEKDLKKAGADTEKIKIAPEYSDEVCEICGKPMVIRTGKFGKFLGCSGYPECKNIKKIQKVVAKCPKCGGDIVAKKSKKGTIFYGCASYPKCEFVSWNIPLEEKCPKCNSYLELKKTKDGDLAVCSNKECDYKLIKTKKGEN